MSQITASWAVEKLMFWFWEPAVSKNGRSHWLGSNEYSDRQRNLLCGCGAQQWPRDADARVGRLETHFLRPTSGAGICYRAPIASVGDWQGRPRRHSEREPPGVGHRRLRHLSAGRS